MSKGLKDVQVTCCKRAIDPKQTVLIELSLLLVEVKVNWEVYAGIEVAHKHD